MTAIQELADELERVREAAGRVVVGYDDVVTDLLVGLIAEGHVLLVGVPGVAKTTLAKTFATATGLSFGRVQFTQDMLPADITGHYYYDQRAGEFRVRKGAVFSNLLLADEINRAPPKTQSALLEAMQENQVTIEGDTYDLPSPFLVIATLNPVDVEGVYHLPEAQLDRFTLRTTMGYLDTETERSMLAHNAELQETVEPVLTQDQIEQAQQAADRIAVADPVITYIQTIGETTRHHDAVELGASPRAMEHLMQAARARALLEARDYVIPEDVQRVAVNVLAHRLILDVDAEVEGKTDVGIVQEVLSDTPVPKGIEPEATPEGGGEADGQGRGQAQTRVDPGEAETDGEASEPGSEGPEAPDEGQDAREGGGSLEATNGGPPTPHDRAEERDEQAKPDTGEDDAGEDEASEHDRAQTGDRETDGEQAGDDEDEDEDEEARDPSVTFTIRDIFDDW